MSRQPKIEVSHPAPGRSLLSIDFSECHPNEPEILAMVRERNKHAQEMALSRWTVNKPKESK
jgi:hypothetical protein